MIYYKSKTGIVAPKDYWLSWAYRFYSQDQSAVKTPEDWWERTQRVLGLTFVEVLGEARDN